MCVECLPQAPVHSLEIMESHGLHLKCLGLLLPYG